MLDPLARVWIDEIDEGGLVTDPNARRLLFLPRRDFAEPVSANVRRSCPSLVWYKTTVCPQEWQSFSDVVCRSCGTRNIFLLVTWHLFDVKN